MHDGGPDLGLHVVAHYRKALLLEPATPVFFASDEDWDAVHEPAARVEDLLHVPLGRHLAAHRQEVHHHVGASLAQDAGDVGGGAGGLGDHLGEIVPEAVVSHAAVDGHAQGGPPRSGRCCWAR